MSVLGQRLFLRSYFLHSHHRNNCSGEDAFLHKTPHHEIASLCGGVVGSSGASRVRSPPPLSSQSTFTLSVSFPSKRIQDKGRLWPSEQRKINPELVFSKPPQYRGSVFAISAFRVCSSARQVNFDMTYIVAILQHSAVSFDSLNAIERRMCTDSANLCCF